MKKSQSKIAVDIVLLPPDEITDKVIEANQVLLKTFDNKIVLNKQNCFPHLSLAMGCINKDDIPKIDTVLKDIANKFSPLAQTISDIRAGAISTGEKVSGFEIGRTSELQLLHETVMNRLTQYFTYDVSLDMIYALPNQQVEEVTTYWIKNYPKGSSFEKFSPHITIGIGEVEGESRGMKFPIKFSVSKLALCHLGNYCTCREILLLHELIKNKSPLVSIGMPVYNGEKYIRQALDSLLVQTYKNFELIISDNASTDRTQKICLEYTARDKRVRFYRNEMNMGAAWNFNRVFELSSGEYFMWASHDDYWDPRYLQSCLEAFDTSDAIVLAGAMCDHFDPRSEEVIFVDQGFSTIGLDPRESYMRYKSTVHGGRHIGGIFSGIYKCSALRKVMPVKKVIANDHLILAELCFQGEFVTVKERLMVKRWGGASTSHRNNARALGINNQLLIICPYLVREVLLQKIICNTDRLTLPEKIRLSCWSLSNYSIMTLRLRFRTLLALAMRPAICARELWRSAARSRSGAKGRKRG